MVSLCGIIIFFAQLSCDPIRLMSCSADSVPSLNGFMSIDVS